METITREEFYTTIAGLNLKLQKLCNERSRFISRRQIIKEVGRTRYEQAKKLGFIHPMGEGKVIVERAEYEAYIEYSKH